MFNLARQLTHALQPLMRCALELDPAERCAWLEELRADCPTVARELERMLPPAVASSAASNATGATRALLTGSPEQLGLRC